MKAHSLSQAIVVRCGVAVAIVLIATAALGYWLISRQLAQSFDQIMIAKVQIRVTQIKEYTHEVEFDFADEFMPEYEREINSQYFEIWTDGVGVFERSNSLMGRNLPVLDMAAGGQF